MTHWTLSGGPGAAEGGCELPEDLGYDLDYLWARPNDDGTFTLGLTTPPKRWPAAW